MNASAAVARAAAPPDLKPELADPIEIRRRRRIGIEERQRFFLVMFAHFDSPETG